MGNQISQMQVPFLGIDKVRHTLPLNENMMGSELKNFIFRHINNDYDLDLMKLVCGGRIIEDNTAITKQFIGSNTIVQEKQDLERICIPGVPITNVQDPASCEKKTAKMPCGCHVGALSMKSFFDMLISTKATEIKCRNLKADNTICMERWDFNVCRKVGIFSKQFANQASESLNRSYIQKNTKACPHCQATVMKDSGIPNRVNCPLCKNPDFCFTCLGKWKTSQADFCGNDTCAFLYTQITQAPWDTKFTLKEKNGTLRVIFLPKMRMCPSCRAVIEHVKFCKHMPCPCNTTFCWVCLSINQGGSWECGSFEDMCQSIAPVQDVRAIIASTK